MTTHQLPQSQFQEEMILCLSSYQTNINDGDTRLLSSVIDFILPTIADTLQEAYIELSLNPQPNIPNTPTTPQTEEYKTMLADSPLSEIPNTPERLQKFLIRHLSSIINMTLHEDDESSDANSIIVPPSTSTPALPPLKGSVDDKTLAEFINKFNILFKKYSDLHPQPQVIFDFKFISLCSAIVALSIVYSQEYNMSQSQINQKLNEMFVKHLSFSIF